LESPDFIKYLSGLISQSFALAHLGQCFPEHIGQKADQNMGLNPLLFLMPDGPQPQIAFLNPKRRFGFTKLDIGKPKFFG